MVGVEAMTDLSYVPGHRLGVLPTKQ